VPEPVKEAAIRAIREGFNRYSVTQGDAELNECIRHTVRQRYGYDPGASLVTAGVSGGLLLAYFVLLNPGDEILIPDPHFVMYKVLADIIGARAVSYDVHPDFRIRKEALESAVSGKTKVLLLNSPSNPTGHVSDQEELKIVAEFARQHDLTVISDEIYDAFVYDEEYHSISEFYDRTVLLSGFSKTYGMPGWRIGYAVGPEEVLDAMKTFQQFTFVCANTVAQKAALFAMRHDCTEQVAAYRQKRDRVVERLSAGYDLVPPGGSFYAYPKLPEGVGGTAFVKQALEEKVLVVPGTAFSGRDTHFRLSFAAPFEKLERGLEVLARLAEQHQAGASS
ncbi:MAG: aminotransferase class I/II-fold pyridoxal phosphate-dependent enzyme, partial [Planctomycetota bacterium]